MKEDEPAVMKYQGSLRFLLMFLALMAAFYVVAAQAWFDRALQRYLIANASAAAAVLRGCGLPVAVTGVTLRSAQTAISVKRGCDGIEPAWLFSAAVLAFAASWRSKLAALLAGVSVILALNVVRIATLFIIRERFPPLFAMAHLELWPALFVLAALVLWLGWIGRMTTATTHAH